MQFLETNCIYFCLKKYIQQYIKGKKTHHDLRKGHNYQKTPKEITKK